MKSLPRLLEALFVAVALIISTGQDLRAADREQAAGPAMEMPTGKNFVNKSPAFSFIYPLYCVGKPLEVPPRCSASLTQRDFPRLYVP